MGVRDDREPGGEHLLEQLQVRTRERAVARRGGHEEARDAGVRTAPREIEGGDVRRARPPLDGDPAVPDVDRDDERGPESRRRVLEKGR